MFKVAIGHTEDPYTEDGTHEIIEACRKQLDGYIPQACILFSAIDYDFAVVLKIIKEAFPDTQVIGCSTSGELSSRLGYAEGSLLLIAFASDTISMATAVARDISKDINTSVEAALSEVKSKFKDKRPSICFTFPDIFTIGTVRLVEELKKRLGDSFPIFGGGASDPWKFDQTHEFYNEEILQDAAPLLFLSGPIEFVFNVGSGWEPFTTQRPIVEADKNTIYKIGDNSALEFYKHYLGGPPTLAHPLAVFEQGEIRFYLRVPFQTDEEKGSILFGGDFPRQGNISICQADPQNLIKETQHLIQQTTHQLENKKPSCAIIISCSFRQKILGTKTREEYRILHEEIPPDIPLFGFYAYGQLSPFHKNAPTFIHNESIVTLFLKETI
jgi:hypothetical protein